MEALAEAEAEAELASPESMRALIQYFENHGQYLDRQEQRDEVSTSQSGQLVSSFVSCIRFNGVPILPPVMTSSKRDEVLQEKKRAVFKENRRRARQSRHLLEKAHSLLESTKGGQQSETRTVRTTAVSSATSGSSRLALERPLVLKPVVTSAWSSVTGSDSITTSSVQSLDSVSAPVPSSLAANTFATAEPGGQEEFGLQTLDSLCSDFMSLEDTLPTDFNGVPLTSVRQQKISHDLLHLSKILKVKDMNSTGGSDISDLPLSEYVGQGEVCRGKGEGRSPLDAVSSIFCHDSQDTVVEASTDNMAGDQPAGDNNTSGFMDNSTDSLQGEASVSGTGSSASTSGMSSANTTATTDSHRSSRSSPRSNLKNNTVHFASFVTEYIDTSASLSSENITIVKKKLPGDKLSRDRSEVKGGLEVKSAATPADISLLVNKELDHDLLGNVSFAELDSSLTPTPLSLPPGSLPFQFYMKTDPSSLDKENDSRQSNKHALSGSSEPAVCPKSDDRGALGPAKSGQGVSDSQGSCKSDATATTSESSNSTLIEDAVASQDSATNSLPLNIVGSEEGVARPGDSQKSGAITTALKSPNLPPEPPQESYHSRQRKLSGDSKDMAVKNDASDNSFHKGHIRRGSYTLNEPSPALLRAQVVSGREGAQEHSEGKPKEGGAPSMPLSIPVQTHVPSEPEAVGKAEHISKYLSQVQLHNSEDLTTSQLSTDLCHYGGHDEAVMSTNHHHFPHSTFNILQALASSHRSLGGSTLGSNAGVVEGVAGSEEIHTFQTLRQTLLQQQQRELEELFVQQRREQMLLQEEIEEHQRRMKEHQEFLISNAPENIKVPSHKHNGELSPDSNSGSSTYQKQFTFTSPKGPAGLSMQSHGHGQASGGGGSHLGSTLLLNSSAASSSPKVKRLVLRSPAKFHPGRRPIGQLRVPPQAYEPEMKVKFDKLTATAKGFLCRRLLCSDKVQDLVKTIKDTREFAFSFQSETPIRQGNFSHQDRTLLERIVAQLQAALLDVHEIFFEIPVAEQMLLIEQTRNNNREKMIKSSIDEVGVRTSAPRISMATLKAQERRRQAQVAESAVFGTMQIRPRTAPSSTNSPRSQASVDLSGPLKRHYQFLLSRALKPAAMKASHQHTHLHSTRPDTFRSETERPQTAPERMSCARVKRSGSGSHGQAGSHTTDAGQPRLNIRPKAAQPPPGSQPTTITTTSKTTKPLKSSSKSWR